MVSERRKFGDVGEETAKIYLLKHGYRIIEKNYQRPWGEIDIVAKFGSKLVFVEVKTRKISGVSYGAPEQNVNAAKKRRLRKICETYLLEKRYPAYQDWRIDVISVTIDVVKKRAQVRHIENAVWDATY